MFLTWKSTQWHYIFSKYIKRRAHLDVFVDLTELVFGVVNPAFCYWTAVCTLRRGKSKRLVGSQIALLIQLLLFTEICVRVYMFRTSGRLSMPHFTQFLIYSVFKVGTVSGSSQCISRATYRLNSERYRVQTERDGSLSRLEHVKQSSFCCFHIRVQRLFFLRPFIRRDVSVSADAPTSACVSLTLLTCFAEY